MNKLELIKEALSDKKGEQIKILDISKISSFADYFVIAQGNNINHVQTLSDNVKEKLASADTFPNYVEGYANAEWILMDYKDIIVHIFDKEKRSFYDLERLWKDAAEV